MWMMVRELRKSGVTIILTTHYIEEAQEMADRIGVINKGELIVVEQKDKLMKRLGKRTLAITLSKAPEALPKELAHMKLAGSVLTTELDSDQPVAPILKQLAEHDLDLVDLTMKESSLEDIFVGLVKA